MTIEEYLAKFVVVEPDRQTHISSQHGGTESVTLWRVVLVRGTDRLALTTLSERQVCQAYATELRRKFLGPLLIEIQTQEQEACLAAIAARGGSR